MSNTVSVASDVVVPCNCQVGSGQKVSTKSAGAEVTVSFSDTAPLAKVRKELEGRAGTTSDTLSVDQPNADNPSGDTSDSLVVFWESTGESSEAGQTPVAIAGQGNIKENPETTLSGIDAEIGAAMMTVDAASTIQNVSSSDTTELQDNTATVEGQSATSETSSTPPMEAYPFEENAALETPLSTSTDTSGFDKHQVNEGVIVDHPNKALSNSVSQEQIPVVVSDSTPKNEAEQATDTLEGGTSGQISTQIAAGNEIVDETGMTDKKVDSELLSSDQSSGVIVVSESDAKSSNTETSSVNQDNKALEGNPTGEEIKTNINQGESASGEAKTDGLYDSKASSVAEPDPVVSIKQDVQGIESNHRDTQVADDVYRQVNESEKLKSPNESQIGSRESTSRANLGEVVTERPKNEVDAPGPSSIALVSGETESAGVPSDNSQFQAIGSTESNRISQISEQVKGAIQAGSQDNVDTFSEVSTQVDEIQAAASSRPTEPLWSSSGTETTTFSSSSGTVSEQITDSLQISLGRGEKEIVIRLNPPELGNVSVRLEEREDGIVGVLEVGKSETRREIEQALPHVIESLQEAGVQVRRLDLTVADQPNKDFGREQLQQDASGQQHSSHQGEHNDSWSGSDYATSNYFQQSVSGSTTSGESLADWSHDRIDMFA